MHDTVETILATVATLAAIGTWSLVAYSCAAW
jgi:hypothetical protein